MKKIIIFIVLLVFGYGVSDARDLRTVKEDWARIMVQRGVKPGIKMTLKEWNVFLNKMVTLTKQQGIAPNKNMTDEEWREAVKRAGAILMGAVIEEKKPVKDTPAKRPLVQERPSVQAPSPAQRQKFVQKPVKRPEPKKTQVSQKQDKPRKKIKPITLDLKNMNMVEVLKILSKHSGQNIVVGDGVKGKVTVFLKKVEFWEAFRIILESRNMAYVEENDILKVMSSRAYEKLYGVPYGKKTVVETVSFQHIQAETAKTLLEPFKSKVGKFIVNETNNSLIIEEAPDQLEAMKSLIKGFDAALETKVFKLNYTTVEDILPKITPLVSKGFGHVQSDKRSNTVVVKDNPERVKEIQDMITAFDVPHKAVLIEAKIVQVVLNDDFQWGINWERAFHYQRNIGNAYSGALTGNSQLLPLETVSRNTSTGEKTSVPGITAHIMSLSGLQIQGTLNFLQTMGNTKVLSSPRIMALNNQEANILVGTKVPKITKTISNVGNVNSNPITTDNVEFEDVGVKLHVTPTIGDDEFVTLKIKPEITALESTITTTEGSSIPIIRTSEAETSVLVKDGVTVLIGGLMEDKKSDMKSGVPLLSKIPILGLLFRSQDTKTQKTELVIFLTPRIVTGEENAVVLREHLTDQELKELRKKEKREKRKEKRKNKKRKKEKAHAAG